MATKESREYNTKAMTFVLNGKTWTVTLPVPDYDEALPKNLATRKAVLIGISNPVNDCVANMPLKEGFTPAQRLEQMQKTFDALMEGKTVERERTAGVSISTFTMAGLDTKLDDQTNWNNLQAAKQMASTGMVPNFKALTAAQLVREKELKARLKIKK
jgi:hypothetical protein